MRSEPQLSLQTARIHGYDLTYAEQGAGTPLILVHGSLCDCRYWKSQLGTLGRSFRVLAPSLRHYWPRVWDGGEFSMRQHVDDLLAFIEVVGEGAAHVVGHSRGARVALEAALRHTGQIRSLTLADPGLPLPQAADDSRNQFRERALALVNSGEVEAGLALFVDTVSGADTWRRMVPWFKDMVRDNASTLAGQVAEHLPPVSREQVQSLALPILLIGGALSPAPYPAVLDMLSQWLPSAHKEVIVGSSHGMNLGNPRAFNSAIEAFLA